MRIAFLLYDTNLGGTEWASLRLMQALRARGHSFEVVSLRPAGPMKAVLEREGIPCADLPPGGKGGWRNIRRLARQLRSGRFDAAILAGHNPVATIAAALARVPLRLQVIHHHHAGVKPPAEWKLIYRLSTLFQHHVVFVSEFVRDEAIALAPALRTMSSVIHNIAPPARIVSPAEKARARQALGLRLDGKLIGNAGRHVPVKRFDVFLAVAAKVALQEPDAQFLLAGAGPLTESLKTKATELGIADRINWRPWLESMADFHAAIDVLLFNSDIDALGMMAVEAMASGVPVVASVLAGGLRDLITSEAHGFLIGVHDVDRLAANVLVALERGQAIGDSGREASQRYGDAARVAAGFDDLLGSARRR